MSIDPNHCDDCATIVGYQERIRELETRGDILWKAADDYFTKHPHGNTEAGIELINALTAYEVAR